MTKSLTKMMKK